MGNTNPNMWSTISYHAGDWMGGRVAGWDLTGDTGHPRQQLEQLYNNLGKAAA